MHFRSSLALILLLSAAAASAQTPPRGTISGTVVDAATSAPLGNGTAAVFDAESEFVTGTATAQDGTFVLELAPGVYRIRVSFVGYTSHERVGVEVAAGSPVDLGEIQLEEAAVQAGDAEVVAERELVEQRADRTVYNVAAQPVTAGGNALETLQTLPSIEVDTDGNVSLRGSQNVAIHVNGRAVPVRGSMLTTMLRQIPASNIERVEVLPNPSARYEPDGMSGIINIVLKQGSDRGLAGGVTVGGGTAPGAEVAANISYQQGKLDVYGSYGFRRESFGMQGTSTRVSFVESGPSTLLQGLAIENGSYSHLLSGTLDYRLSGKSLIGLSGSIGINDGTADFLTSYRFSPDPAAALDMEREVGVATDGFNADVSTTFKHQFLGEENQLSAEARFTRNDEGRVDDFLDIALIPVAAETFSRSTADDLVDETSLLFDYNAPVAGLRLETGAKYTGRTMENDRLFERLDAATGPIVVAGRSNRFDYNERVVAGYLQASRSFGALEAQAGVRAETATRELMLSQADEDIDDTYNTLYPSAFLQYTMSPGTLAKLSFSRRVNRPRPFQLDPTPQFEDTLLVDRGNPELQPEYTSALELTLQYKFIATLTPFYRRTTDVIRRRIVFDPQSGATTGTFQNLDTQDTYGADLTLMPKIGPVRGMISASAYRSVTDGGSIETGLASDGFVWSLRGNMQAQIGKGTTVQLFAFYRGALEVEDGRISPFGIASLGLSQQLLGDRLRLAVRVNDILQTAEFNFRTGNAHYTLIGLRNPDLQQASATLTYTFGKPGRPRPQRPQEGQQDPVGGMGF